MTGSAKDREQSIRAARSVQGVKEDTAPLRTELKYPLQPTLILFERVRGFFLFLPEGLVLSVELGKRLNDPSVFNIAVDLFGDERFTEKVGGQLLLSSGELRKEGNLAEDEQLLPGLLDAFADADPEIFEIDSNWGRTRKEGEEMALLALSDYRDHIQKGLDANRQR